MVRDNVAVVQTLESTDIAVGQSITLSGCATQLNGTQTVFAVPTYLFLGVDDQGDYYYDCMVNEVKQCKSFICFDPWSLKMELKENENEKV